MKPSGLSRHYSTTVEPKAGPNYCTKAFVTSYWTELVNFRTRVCL